MLFEFHFRQLVRLRQNDGKGKDMIVQVFHHLQIVRCRVVTRVDEHKHMGNFVLILKKSVERFRPLFLFRFGYSRKPVPGQIGENKRPEIEIVDQPRSTRLTTRFCELFPIRHHIDKRAFPDV